MSAITVWQASAIATSLRDAMRFADALAAETDDEPLQKTKRLEEEGVSAGSGAPSLRVHDVKAYLERLRLLIDQSRILKAHSAQLPALVAQAADKYQMLMVEPNEPNVPR